MCLNFAMAGLLRHAQPAHCISRRTCARRFVCTQAIPTRLLAVLDVGGNVLFGLPRK